MKVLLTGYSGFVGFHLLEKIESKYSVTLYGRKESHLDGVMHHYGKLNGSADFSAALSECEVVIHAAARAHVMDENESEPLKVFREVNTVATLNLAKQSVTAGVKRFIFISSIKVNGESTQLGEPFTEKDVRNPEDFYGKSKSEAEEQLLELAKETGLEVVIIRPTLVYGPGVKANFASLLKLVSKGLPLPFGCIKHNKRSLVSVKNLVDLIITCIDHPKATNQVFLVSDDHDVSTASMVKHMSYALGKLIRLLPVPLWCYHLVGKLTNKSSVVDRLIGSLQVDISHTKDTLGWVPPQTLEDGFKETAEYFLLNKSK